MTTNPPHIEDVLGHIQQWLQEGRRVALATVVSTWGSSPRPVGSQLAVDERGAMVGSVSGGCVEAAVVQESLAVIASGAPRLLEYGVTDERAWEVGLACGGRIKVYVEAVT
jgi:xanthine/CO dehydrogenase XdhC/CoxF family maturation factor